MIEHYDRLVQLLAPHLRVVCFDLPGYGFSFPSRGFDFAPSHFVGVVAALLERLGDGPYVLAFPCIAGLIAIKLAVDRPRLVSHLVVVQCGSWPEQVRWAQRVDKTFGGIIGTPIAGQLAMAVGKRLNARFWYRAALPAGADTRPFLNPALWAFRYGGCFCLASSFQAFGRAEIPEIGEVTQPALVLWGLKDRTHRRTDRRSVQSYVPHAQWAEFERAGHFPEIEEPERFRDLLFGLCWGTQGERPGTRGEYPTRTLDDRD